jgi:hypothetical protein
LNITFIMLWLRVFFFIRDQIYHYSMNLKNNLLFIKRIKDSKTRYVCLIAPLKNVKLVLEVYSINFNMFFEIFLILTCLIFLNWFKLVQKKNELMSLSYNLKLASLQLVLISCKFIVQFILFKYCPVRVTYFLATTWTLF